MICYVDGCDGFAKRCWRAVGTYAHAKGGYWVVVHACADHWPRSVS